MADALALLREFGSAGRAIVIDGSEAVFDERRLDLNVATRYLSAKGTGYPLAALALLLELQDKPQSEYLRACLQRGLKLYVTAADRSAVLGYLTGEQAASLLTTSGSRSAFALTSMM